MFPWETIFIEIGRQCTPWRFNIGEIVPSQKETSIPSIIFQGRAVKLRGWKHIWGMYHLQGLQNDGFMAPFLVMFLRKPYFGAWAWGFLMFFLIPCVLIWSCLCFSKSWSYSLLLMMSIPNNDTDRSGRGISSSKKCQERFKGCFPTACLKTTGDGRLSVLASKPFCPGIRWWKWNAGRNKSSFVRTGQIVERFAQS